MDLIRGLSLSLLLMGCLGPNMSSATDGKFTQYADSAMQIHIFNLSQHIPKSFKIGFLMHLCI